MVKEKDGRTAEKSLDDFGKLIKEQLKTNYDLRNPTTGLDPKVATSWPEETRILNRELVGSHIQGRVILFRCTAYTS
jgi:hypothetical protein